MRSGKGGSTEVKTGITRRSLARIEGFLKSCALALPSADDGGRSNRSILLGHSGSSILSSGSTSSGSGRCYQQFRFEDLSIRLEIYCRSLRRVKENDDQEECVVGLEPPKVVRARANFLIRSFLATVGCVRSIRGILTNLVKALTLELLAVDTIGFTLLEKINRLVSEYEHKTSFASLAFLSSPEEAVDAHLLPMIMTYINYLKSNHMLLEAECELESMLKNSLDPVLRKTFKTAEFHSVGHLLEVCRANKKALQHIMLPCIPDELSSRMCSDPKEVNQALKDLRREIITINGNILPPAHSRRELVRLLSETMNARTTSIYHNYENCDKAHFMKESISSSGSFDEVCIIDTSGDEDNTKNEDEDEDESFEDLSGNEGDCDESDAQKGNGSISKISHHPKSKQRKGSHDGVKRRRFDGATVDKLTARLLIAAGRSNTGGDTYFFVRDLFGGEGVVVVPSRSQPKFSTNRRRGTKQKKSPGTIEITMRLSSITIKIHAKYDVYPEVCDDDCEPLIQLHTTTTETISLQEVRSRPTLSPERNHWTNEHDGAEMLKVSHLVLRERKTHCTGERVLAMRPAPYKKVQEWNTPS